MVHATKRSAGKTLTVTPCTTCGREPAEPGATDEQTMAATSHKTPVALRIHRMRHAKERAGEAVATREQAATEAETPEQQSEQRNCPARGKHNQL